MISHAAAAVAENRARQAVIETATAATDQRPQAGSESAVGGGGEITAEVAAQIVASVAEQLVKISSGTAGEGGGGTTAEVAEQVVAEIRRRAEAAKASRAVAGGGRGGATWEGREAERRTGRGGYDGWEVQPVTIEDMEDERRRAIEALNESKLLGEDSRIFRPEESLFEDLEQDPSM